MRRSRGVAVVVLLGMLALAAAAVPAFAQTTTDVPGGGSLHPVTSISELPSSQVTPYASDLWGFLSYALQQQISIGFWRWLPMTTNPAATAPPLWTRLGGWSRP